jgi:uncharacterized protein (TIGR03437 family)
VSPFRHAAIAVALSFVCTAQERQLRESFTTIERPAKPEPRALAATAAAPALLIELAEKPSGSSLFRSARLEGAQQRLSRWISSHGGRVLHRYRLLGLVAAEVAPEALDDLRAHPEVSAVSADVPVEFQIDRSVPAIAVERTWAAGITGAGESVILFDTGVNADHAALRGRVDSAVYLQGSNCPPEEAATGADFDGHGTHMAGIIASAGTPAQPNFRGVAYGLSRIINAKVGCRGGTVMSSALLAALESALTANPAPIAVSAATAPATADDDVFSRAIDSLIDRFNLIWINAAGNGGPDEFTVASPAIAHNGISVANIHLEAPGGPAPFETSARGPTLGGRFKPDLAAPGTAIFSTGILGDGFLERTGTSMAAAHVAGAAALLRQAGVQDRLAMKALLINTTNRDGWDIGDGWGMVNVDRAYAQRQNTVVGAVAAASGSSAYYRVIVPPGGSYFATLAWNRTLTGTQSFVRNLDLSVYRADTAAAVDRSLFLNQNVEQVAFRNPAAVPAAYIIRVESRNGGARAEPFALASSLPLESFAAPALEVSCTFPGPAAPARPLELPCTARNTGGLPYFNVTFTALLGNTPLGSIGVGALPVNETKTGRVRFNAPVTPGTYAINVRAAGASFGVADTVTVSGSITVTAPGGGGGGPVIAAVVNGASFAGAFTSGSWVTITGAQLSATTRAWAAADFVDGRLPTALDGVRVTINGKAAYPAYVSPSQLNVLAPDDDFEGEAEIRVRNALGESPPARAAKLARAPALFTYSAGGATYAAARAADGTLIGPVGALPGVVSRPAQPGEVISLYATGCGATNPPLASGSLVSAPAPLVALPTVRVGEDLAQVRYAGVVAPGLCQINIAIPDPIAVGGEVALSLSFEDASALNEPLLVVGAPE